MNTCKTCAHWCANEKSSDTQRECRRHPPSVTLIPVQALQGQGLTPVTYHPITMEHHSCGEHSENMPQILNAIVNAERLRDTVRDLASKWTLGTNDVLIVDRDTGTLNRTPTAEEFERLISAAKGESGQVDLDALRNDPRN